MTATDAPKTEQKGNLKIDVRLHAMLKAAAALSQPSKGLNEFAEKHLWSVVGGKPATPKEASK